MFCFICIMLGIVGNCKASQSVYKQDDSEKKYPSASEYKYSDGSYEYGPNVPLVRSYHNVFPDSLIGMLEEEIDNHGKISKTPSGLKDDKGSTNWVPMDVLNKPRCAVEMAIAILLKFAFPNGTFPDGGIAGAEWWVQVRDTTENIGFHTDKDEGVASEEQWMKMPLLSSVTYLTNVGGPTFVMNQYTNRGGNMSTPEVPENGILVYPKRNRHMLFHVHFHDAFS